MPSYEAEMADFERYDAQVVGISVDSIPSHIALAKSIGGIERYPLLAGFHPKGDVARHIRSSGQHAAHRRTA
jgi:alkyl hydroperoxide reductase subunit AhpC